jgi:hypothetical protein
MYSFVVGIHGRREGEERVNMIEVFYKNVFSYMKPIKIS